MSHTIDHFFSQLIEKITKSIQIFVAAIFALITIGMVYGIYAAQSPHAILLYLAPPLLAVIAYYSTDFAIIAFVLFILIFLV